MAKRTGLSWVLFLALGLWGIEGRGGESSGAAHPDFPTTLVLAFDAVAADHSSDFLARYSEDLNLAQSVLGNALVTGDLTSYEAAALELRGRSIYTVCARFVSSPLHPQGPGSFLRIYRLFRTRLSKSVRLFETADCSAAAIQSAYERAAFQAGASRADVKTGYWGGDHVQLRLSETGGRLEYDCAHGDIQEPIVVDETGAFEVRGHHVLEHGGPIAPGEQVIVHPARYRGTVDTSGQSMSFSITLTDTGESAGTFSVRYDAPGRLMKCL